MQRMVLLTANEHELILQDLSSVHSKIERLLDKTEDESVKALLYSMDMRISDAEEMLNEHFTN